MRTLQRSERIQEFGKGRFVIGVRAAAVALGLTSLGIIVAVVPADGRSAQAMMAQAAPAAAAPDLKNGRQMFDTWACGTCHALADAGAAGQIGPGLDNPALTTELIIDRVTNGAGAMPGFGGQMTEKEIADLAAYIKSAAPKQ
jgi:mono/diheme cytochrome c family protein